MASVVKNSESSRRFYFAVIQYIHRRIKRKKPAIVIMVVDRERLIQGRNERFFELVHNSVR